MNLGLIFILLTITGIGVAWYLLYQERQKNEKEYEDKNEFDILLTTTEVPEEDKDFILDKNKTYITEEEYILETPDIPEIVEKLETPEVVEKPKKKKRKYNKKKNK